MCVCVCVCVCVPWSLTVRLGRQRIQNQCARGHD